MRSIDLLVLVPLVAGLPLAACRQPAADAAQVHSQPATVEPVEGTSLSRVLLSPRAAERLGIETAAVRDTQITFVPASVSSAGPADWRAIPYAAVLYDPNGDTWVYTSPDSMVFVRAPITVEYIEEDLAVLSSGPPVGTKIVTVGVAELFGTEFGVGH
jgi:hypothetical protein